MEEFTKEEREFIKKIYYMGCYHEKCARCTDKKCTSYREKNRILQSIMIKIEKSRK